MFVTELIERNISRNYKLFCAISKYKFVLGYVFCCASFLTLTGIAIERLLALCLHLRYKALVTLPKVLAAVTYIWIQSVSATAFCFITEFRSFLYGVAVSSLLNMAINIVACVCVLQIVRKHERRIESEAIYPRISMTDAEWTLKVLNELQSQWWAFYPYTFYATLPS